MTNRLTETFCSIVTIDSPTGFEEPLLDYLVTVLSKLTATVKRDTFGNVYARVEGAGEALFYAAHVDTVEPGRSIKPQIKNGYITSDGNTVLGGDNKIAVACILEFLNRLQETKLRHRPIEIIFTKSEEVGNYGALNFDYSFLQSKEGFCFDCDSPVGTIITGSPFYDRFDIVLRGKEAHASHPEQAINALYLLRDFLVTTQLGIQNNEILVNIGQTKGGVVRNTIPGEISLAGEIRAFQEQYMTYIKTQILEQLEAITKRYSASYKAEFVRENPGYEHTQKNAVSLLNYAKQAMKLVNIKPTRLNTWSVSDANIYNDNKGIKCINLGNGGEFPHSKMERIKMNEMERLVHLMLQLITH